MKNIFVMTVRGRQDLTETCLKGLRRTAGEHVRIFIVDAGEGKDKILPEMLNECSKPYDDHTSMSCFYTHALGCGISAGWNIGIEEVKKNYGTDNIVIWLVNNDIIFHKPGWLQMLEQKMLEPNVAMVGNYAMAASGYRFVTGAVWGFKLKEALKIAEGEKVLDEYLNFSYQDVDLSVRMEKAGYEAAAFFGIEFGDDPYMTHLVSSTTGLSEAAISARKAEEDVFDKKHGRKE